MDAGEAVPVPSGIEVHRANPEFAGRIWAVVEVAPALLDDKVERGDITLPRRVLARLDVLAASQEKPAQGTSPSWRSRHDHKLQ